VSQPRCKRCGRFTSKQHLVGLGHDPVWICLGCFKLALRNPRIRIKAIMAALDAPREAG
jgi:hypothetical protein